MAARRLISATFSASVNTHYLREGNGRIKEIGEKLWASLSPDPAPRGGAPGARRRPLTPRGPSRPALVIRGARRPVWSSTQTQRTTTPPLPSSRGGARQRGEGRSVAHLAGWLREALLGLQDARAAAAVLASTRPPLLPPCAPLTHRGVANRNLNLYLLEARPRTRGGAARPCECI